jgi:hypothetical protein
MSARLPLIRPTRLIVPLLCALLPLAAAAATYEVELKSTLNDLPIKIETVPMDGMLVVKLTNAGQVKVRCDLRYDASPQPIGRAHVYVEPGKTEQNPFRAKRKWFNVLVDVTCKPAEGS